MQKKKIFCRKCWTLFAGKNKNQYKALDKKEYPINIFLISPQKHVDDTH